MRILRDTTSINEEISTNPDQCLATLLAAYLQFNGPPDPEVGELLTVILIEPGDTLATLDNAMQGNFLINHYSGRRHGQPGFVPCFETCEEYATFYQMLFIESDEGHGLLVLIPKEPSTDPELITMCVLHAIPAPELT